MQQSIKQQQTVLLFALIVVTLCVLVTETCQCKNFKRVRSFLNRQEKGKAPISYLLAVEKELRDLNMESLDLSSATNFLYKSALEEVAKFRLLLTRPQCTANEADILAKTKEYSYGHSYIANDDGGQVRSLAPLDALVHHVSLAHANYCRDKYYAKFSEAYSVVEQSVKQGAEFRRTWFDQHQLTRAQPYSIERQIEDLLEYNWITDVERFVGAYEHILRLSQAQNVAAQQQEQSESVSPSPSRSEFKSNYRAYLYKPCKEYLKQLGRPILLPAKLDAEMYARNSYFNLSNPNLMQFYVAMASTIACKSLIEQKDLVLRKLMDLWTANHDKPFHRDQRRRNRGQADVVGPSTRGWRGMLGC